MSFAPEVAGSSGSSTRGRLQSLLRSNGLTELTPEQAELLARYLTLLLRWNAKMNLTGIRDEEGILRRHFLESIVCARLVPSGVKTLLDFGSGGGFPGVPCAICRPEISVTLADSQAKKAAFLNETVRSLGLNATVYHGRVEDLDGGTRFDAVTLRAVDLMRHACNAALVRVRAGGWLVILATESSLGCLVSGIPGVSWQSPVHLPGSEQEVVLLGRKA